MAPNISRADFLVLFDEFASVATGKIDAYLNIATTRVPASVWGGAASYATALLTAHMLSTTGINAGSGGGSAGGPVTAEQVGEVSRSYASFADINHGDSAYMTTRYGIDFIALRNETVIPGTVSGPETNPPVVMDEGSIYESS